MYAGCHFVDVNKLLFRNFFVIDQITFDHFRKPFGRIAPFGFPILNGAFGDTRYFGKLFLSISKILTHFFDFHSVFSLTFGKERVKIYKEFAEVRLSAVLWLKYERLDLAVSRSFFYYFGLFFGLCKLDVLDDFDLKLNRK